MKKLFCDLHHAGLGESLRILFEDRLGYEVYFPIGEKWFEEGYWKIAAPYGNAPDTINQYLGFDQSGLESPLRLNEFHTEQDKGIYKVYDKFHSKWIKKITFDQFTQEKFDLIIPTIPDHQSPFKNLIKKYQPKAKLIFQLGNEGWRPDYNVVDNVMASVFPFKYPEDKNVLFYHQEFDQNIFQYQPPKFIKKIVSVMNGLPQSSDAALYKEYKEKMPEFEFRSYGGGCEDGSVHSIEEIKDKMVEADFIWHLKEFDGFGHVIHNAYSLGRPVITKEKYYKGKLGGLMLYENVNYINIETGSVEENVDKIRNFSQPHKLQSMSIEARKQFERIVNYDKEEELVREFLDRLI